MSSPMISAIMAVYNGEKYLTSAIKSVLEQTYNDFEFIIINDASEDGTQDIIEESQSDSRIITINNESNLGVAASRNIGLEIAKGEYIAVIDADDISLPDRFEKQLKFMKENKSVGICGSWYETFNESSSFVYKPSSDFDYIKAHHLFSPCLAHPSVMFRKSFLEQNLIKYNSLFKYALDYELWVRCDDKTIISNIEEVLIRYRKHESQISTAKYEKQQLYAGQVRRKKLDEFGLYPTDEEFFYHQMICTNSDKISSLKVLGEIHKWLLKISQHNQKNVIYNQVALNKVLFKHWLSICNEFAKRYRQKTMNTWELFYSSPLIQDIELEEFSLDIQEMIRVIKRSGSQNIAIFGTSRVGIYLKKQLEENGVYVLKFFDNIQYGEIIESIPVSNTDSLLMDEIEVIILSVLGDHYKKIEFEITKKVKGKKKIEILACRDFMYAK